MTKDYYAILDLDRGATADQIRSRFKILAREMHPDRFSGEEKARAETEFQSVTEAFNVLNDPERRRKHDLDLSQPHSNHAGLDRGQMSKVYLQRGIKAYKEKNYFEAAENFDRATATEPENAQAWYYLALACSNKESWRSRGMSAISKACELDNMNSAYHKLAGRLFADSGMRIRAERYYRLALRWGGEDVEVSQALEELKRKK